MKRVLITGVGSYIGTHVALEMMKTPSLFSVKEVDLHKGIDPSAFEGVDAVVHVAGLAHQKETEGNALRYQTINCDLAVETAKAAKAAGVSQFVFLSSMSVYGMELGEITADTLPSPVTYYGKSKWEAEKQLSLLEDEYFRVAALRPPMVYGRGCRGNYPRLSALAQSVPFFPKTQGKRSMIYIDTLSAFIADLVASGNGGLYFPQNREYVSTSEMVKQIANVHGKRLLLIGGFSWLLKLLSKHNSTFAKVFGSLTYDQSMSQVFRRENEVSFEQSIRFTEVGE